MLGQIVSQLDYTHAMPPGEVQQAKFIQRRPAGPDRPSESEAAYAWLHVRNDMQPITSA